MPAGRPQAFRINARELLRQPGLDKRVALDLPAAELGVDDERMASDVSVDLVATSTIDGVTVRGSVSFSWRTTCRRCLTDISGNAASTVDEVYHDDAGPDDDAFELIGDQIDLLPAVREYVLLELPDDELCRDDCAGICPVCGIDLNTGSCDCDTSVGDDRWAALEGFVAEAESTGDPDD